MRSAVVCHGIGDLQTAPLIRSEFACFIIRYRHLISSAFAALGASRRCPCAVIHIQIAAAFRNKKVNAGSVAYVLIHCAVYRHIQRSTPQRIVNHICHSPVRRASSLFINFLTVVINNMKRQHEAITARLQIIAPTISYLLAQL